MRARYETFLLRLWRGDEGAQRIMIEHIQSDARTVVTSLSDAFDWLQASVDRRTPKQHDNTAACDSLPTRDDDGARSERTD
jgi:hypothetical protein